MLQDAGCTLDMLPEECRGVPQFLSRTEVEIHQYAIRIQIVETNEATVPRRTLQKFLLAAAAQLGDIKVLCEGNAECFLMSELRVAGHHALNNNIRSEDRSFVFCLDTSIHFQTC
ncbi:hypothetical protein FOZ63_028348 [Perkinsus olseni]|uniref:Uncharacterized protein n=1 Tax=Perkinsus olseni TaxID=32597 RepID=A0A7J6QSE8_PEROL|nr:hypothetical protein FOZ63_028348 [Perkinsus olseni]